MYVRELQQAEIPILRDFAPPDWKTDLSLVFGKHYGQPYFHPIVAELDGVVVGCASGLLNGNAGWLGNIIVLPEWRGRGIGRVLTQGLMDFFRAQKVQSQILIATSMGEPVYRKLGFEIVSYYLFFVREDALPASDPEPCVRPLEHDDEEAVLALDQAVSGEQRQAFISQFLADASVHESASGIVDGYYLPDLGNGLVIASNDEAGVALMRRKLSQGANMSVVPEANKVAADFLRSHGFVETSRVPRMALGGDVSWQPERVYCRASGYCG